MFKLCSKTNAYKHLVPIIKAINNTETIRVNNYSNTLFAILTRKHQVTVQFEFCYKKLTKKKFKINNYLKIKKCHFGNFRKN